MTTRRTGLAIGWRILWGTLATIAALFLVAALYVVWALNNMSFG